MKKIIWVFVLALLFSCTDPTVNYYRVLVKTESGQVIYDETGPNYYVNINHSLLGNVVVIEVTDGYRSAYSGAGADVIFSVTGNNLIVTRELVRSEKR
jgi:hypothetical protein